MKQLAQRMKDGELRVVDVPRPEINEWQVLVRTAASLVSAGTERAKVEIGRDTLLGKARRRPDEVRKVVEKIRADGISATVGAVRNRLETFTPLGYCAAGRVERVGARVRDIQAGDIVACGGEEAAHAEMLAVPGNLCAAVPAVVQTVHAAFTTVGAIALHGFRQADIRLGERVAVVGMGLVGQLTARIAHSAGCEVIGIDLEPWRIELAERAGALHLGRVRANVSDADMGTCDAVLVTAAAPTTNDPVLLAADLARDRGKIVVVGDVLLNLDRRRLYAKELELRLARSYGPGRYDREYEKRGLDYPMAYVRWTERRNMEEFLRLLAEGRVTVSDLITHMFPIAEADRALDAVTKPEQRALGVIIDYATTRRTSDREVTSPRRRPLEPRPLSSPSAHVGFIGAGSFARRHLIPLAKRHGLILDRVATASGLSAAAAAEQFGFRRGACAVDELLADDDIAGVVVATRHNLHGGLALSALQAGKRVFVEKPLCLTEEELLALRSALDRPDAPPLMVGFNRRCAPLTQRLQRHLNAAQGPTNVTVRVNAGPLPADHWLNDAQIGGGRLLGEGCHFLDLISVLTGSEPIAVTAQAWQRADEQLQSSQEFSVSIRFADGSLGVLLYGTAGAAAAGKELIEAHRGDRSGRIDDFRSLRLWGGGGRHSQRPRREDKGHTEEMRLFAAVLRGEAKPPSFRTYRVSTELSFAALRSLETGAEVRLNTDETDA